MMAKNATKFAFLLIASVALIGTCMSHASLEISPACTPGRVSAKTIQFQLGQDAVLLQPPFKTTAPTGQVANFDITLNRSCLVDIRGVNVRLRGACQMDVLIVSESQGQHKHDSYWLFEKFTVWRLNIEPIVRTNTSTKLVLQLRGYPKLNPCVVDTDTFSEDHRTGILTTDVDECEAKPSICTNAHRCVNTHGSYHCSTKPTSNQATTEGGTIGEVATPEIEPSPTSPRPLATLRSPEETTVTSSVDILFSSTVQPSATSLSVRPSSAPGSPDLVIPMVVSVLVVAMAIVAVVVVIVIKKVRGRQILSDSISARQETRSQSPIGAMAYSAEGDRGENDYDMVTQAAATGDSQRQVQCEPSDYLTPIELLSTLPTQEQ